MQDAIYYTKYSNGFVNIIRESSCRNTAMTLVLTVKVGSMNDGCKKGISHFLEHCNMIFDKHHEIVNNTSIVAYAHTDYFSTNYFFKLLSNDSVNESLDETFYIIQNILLGKYIRQDIIEEVSNDILIEYASKGINSEYNVLKSFLNNTFFKDKEPIGIPDIFCSYSYEDLISFYTAFYQANRIAISIVGSIPKKILIPKIRNLYFPNYTKETEKYIFKQPDHGSQAEICRDKEKISIFRFIERRLLSKPQYIKETMIRDIALDSLQIAIDYDENLMLGSFGCKNVVVTDRYNLIYFCLVSSKEIDFLSDTDLIEKIIQCANNFLQCHFEYLLINYERRINNLYDETSMNDKVMEMVNHYTYHTPLLLLDYHRKILKRVIAEINLDDIMNDIRFILYQL